MSPEEVIARAIHDLFDPYDKAAAEVTSRILSALKSAGLVVVPYHGKVEWGKSGKAGTLDCDGRLTIFGITEPEYHQFISQLGEIAIREATSPDAPETADPARRD